MEPDISILRKTGHFYFALTPWETRRRPMPRAVMALIASCKMSCQHKFQTRNFGVESFYIEHSTLANRFFDTPQPSINWLQA
jgi:hypothetical protein